MTEIVEYWSDIAARDWSLCIASPDKAGPHRPIPGNDPFGPDDCVPIECAECGQTGSAPMPDVAIIDWG